MGGKCWGKKSLHASSHPWTLRTIDAFEVERKAIHAELPFLRCPFDRHVQREARSPALIGLESTREGRGLGGVACGTEMAVAGSERRGVVKGERGGGSGDEGARGEEDDKDENGLHDIDKRGNWCTFGGAVAVA